MAAAVLFALIAISARDAHAGEDTAMPTAAVRIENLAAVPADYLVFAEGRAGDVFSRIGVHLAWIDDQTAVRDHLRPPFTVVLITSGPELAVRSSIVDALGFADPSVSRAHVIYDRVEELTSRSRRSPPSLLGDIIAHELGHLMIAAPEHSARGIMRSGVELLARPIETFTPPQARQIISRLTQRP